jgi:hypothetical protein
MGACSMWNILRASWFAASMRSSGRGGARMREAARGAQRRDGGERRAQWIARGWGHGDVQAWLLGARREQARGCEGGRGGLLLRRFVGKRDEHVAPCDCDALVVGTCGV